MVLRLITWYIYSIIVLVSYKQHHQYITAAVVLVYSSVLLIPIYDSSMDKFTRTSTDRIHSCCDVF